MSKGRSCATCQGVRLHRIRTSVQPGKRVRVLACLVCETESDLPIAEAPGISCTKCRNVGFRVLRTHPKPGGVVRIKECTNPDCRHRIRTREKVDSVSV